MSGSWKRVAPLTWRDLAVMHVETPILGLRCAVLSRRQAHGEALVPETNTTGLAACSREEPSGSSTSRLADSCTPSTS